MKINKILTFFGLAVILTTVLRFFQIKYTIEFSTGFFINNFSSFGYFILAAIFLAALLCGIFGFAYYKNPETAPKNSKILGIVSFIPAMTIILENIGGNTNSSVNLIQVSALNVVAVLTSIFFILFGVSKFIDFALPDWTTMIPAAYFIIKMIVDFAKISSLAIISDYILSISAYCVILLFFIAFTKLYNNINDEKNFKKLFAFGLSSAVLSISQSLAYFIVNFIFDNSYNHVSAVANLNFIGIGMFITVFLMAYFNPKND